MKIIKGFIVLFVLMLSILDSSAQGYTTGRTVISALGGSYGGSTYTGDFTIGELAINTFEGSFILNQGFHAGPVLFNEAKQIETSEFKINAFPNPVKDQLKISLIGKENIALELRMYSLSGKMVKSIVMNEAIKQIDLSDLKAGTYFIHAIDKVSKKRMNSLKIQKL